MPAVPAALSYVAFLAMWCVCIYAALLLRRSRKQFAAFKPQIEFANWAEWTILSVTDRTGMIQAETLGQFYRRGGEDQVWTDPIAVSVWHADANLHRQYLEEAEAVYDAARRENTGG